MNARILAAAAAVALTSAPAWAGPHSGPSYTPDLLPPVSHAGECYARVKIPARYESTSQTVMTHAPYETMRVSEPEFRSRTEQVMVKEPSVRFEVRQPTFKSITEKVVTRPSYEKLSVSPPQFSTVTETFAMSEPRLVWKKGNPADLIRQGYTIHSTADGGAYGKGYSSTTQYGAMGGERCGPTCEIWCLVEEPGVKKSFQRRVMSSPGEVRRHTVPAQYQHITKQVVADPGGVREIQVPGEYRSVTVHDLVRPAESYSELTPPTYGEVHGKVMVEAERYEWRRVVCKPGTAVSKDYSIRGSGGGNYSAYPQQTPRSGVRGSGGGNYAYSSQPAMSYESYSGGAYGGIRGSGGGNYSSTGTTTVIDDGHMGGHHSGHAHGGDHYSSQSHSGSVHTGHAHGEHESFRELSGGYSSGTIYDQPAYGYPTGK